MSALVWCGVAVLGGVGAVARVLVAASVTDRLPRAFPLGIFVVNVSGAFLIGVLAGASARGDAYRLAGIAFLGSYTTFSTWMLETQQLAGEGRRRAAVANVVFSVLIGLGAVALGRVIGSRL